MRNFEKLDSFNFQEWIKLVAFSKEYYDFMSFLHHATRKIAKVYSDTPNFRLRHDVNDFHALPCPLHSEHRFHRAEDDLQVQE